MTRERGYPEIGWQQLVETLTGTAGEADGRTRSPIFPGINLRNLSPAGTVLSVAAGGTDEVFAITADHHLWDHRLSGWALLSTGTFQSVTGTETPAGQGEAFAVVLSGSEWEYNPAFPGSHWHIVSPLSVVFAAAPRRRVVHA